MKKGIKWDVSVFLVLKHDSDWRKWSHKATTHVKAQGVDNVFNGKCDPSTPEEEALFLEQKKCMMSVFAATLKTTKGKQLLKKHAETSNSQKVHVELKEHCLKSTHADDERQQMNEFLLTAKASNWNGSLQDFVACLCKKANECNQKSSVPFNDNQI